MSEARKPEEGEKSAKPADGVDLVQSRDQSLNSVCELKDAPDPGSAAAVRPVSRIELGKLFSSAATVNLGDGTEPVSYAALSRAGTGGIELSGLPQKSKELPAAPDAKSASALTRSAQRALAGIERLLPAIPEQTIESLTPESYATQELLPLASEDEKKLRNLLFTASEADLKEMVRLDTKGILGTLKSDPRLSEGSRRTLEILLSFPKEKRSDQQLEQIARIALETKNADIFNETMSQSSSKLRASFTEQELKDAFKDDSIFKRAKQYLEQGRESPFEQLKDNLSYYFFNNREGMKLALSKLKKEDLEQYLLGKRLYESGKAIITDTAKMSREDRELYELGANVYRGRGPQGLSPAKEQSAVEHFKNVEALKVYSSLKDKASSSPAVMPELDAIAGYPAGKIASNLVDLRQVGWGAPAVREVAKVIREMSEEDKSFYKNNPDRREDIFKILEQLRLTSNDASALKRYFQFTTDGSISAAEKALYRQPIISAIEELNQNSTGPHSRDMDHLVSLLENMTDAELALYRTKPEFRKALKDAVLYNEIVLDPETARPEYRRFAQSRIKASDITLRLLEMIDKGRPQADIVTKLQLTAKKDLSRNSSQTVRQLQEALKDPLLREKLNSGKTEDKAFRDQFMKAARLSTSPRDFTDIVEPMIKTGVAPLEALVKHGQGYFTDDPRIFEDIASAPEPVRKRLIQDPELAERTLSGLGQANMKLALQVSESGKFTLADQIAFGFNSKFGGAAHIMSNLEKLSLETPEAIDRFKREFAVLHPQINLQERLQSDLSPMEYARAKFILSTNLSEREKYLETLDLVHSSISGWGSRWTESVFGSATRSQTIAALNDYTSEITKAKQDIDKALADEKVRNLVWKAVENHLSTRSDLMMYGGDAAGLAVPLGAGAFAAYVLGAEITVPVTAILIMAGTLSRMGVRQGALGDFYDARTKNLIIDTITSTILSSTAMFGSTHIAALAALGKPAATATANSTMRILSAVDTSSNRLLLREGAKEIIEKDAQQIIVRAVLGAQKSFDERMIMATAEKVVKTEGFASASARQEAVNQVFNTIKNSLRQSYNVELSATMRFAKAGGIDLSAGLFAGGSASAADDLLHGRDLGFHNLIAALQAGVFAGTLGSGIRGLASMRSRVSAPHESTGTKVEGQKLDETGSIHEYNKATAARPDEFKTVVEQKAIEVSSSKGETLRRFEFETAPGESSASPSRIVIGSGEKQLVIKADPQKANVWTIEKNGTVQPGKLEAKILVSPRDGSYTVSYITDQNASWFSKVFPHGSSDPPLVREVTYHPDGRVVYKGPTENNWFPEEGSIFWRESALDENWQAPGGEKTWITADRRVYKEVADKVWYSQDGMFVEGKEAIKVKEVKAEKLDEDIRWINEDDTTWLSPQGQLKAGLSEKDIPISSASANGGYYKIHTGQGPRPNGFKVFKDGKLVDVDYYLIPAAKFEATYRALPGVQGSYIKTESMVVRQLGKGETASFLDSHGARQNFKEGDYVVISEKNQRGIAKAEYERLYVDAPSKSINADQFVLPPIEGKTSFDPASGIGKAQWVKRIDDKVIERGEIFWHTKEGIIRVVGGSEARVYSMSAASARGYRFFWHDGSAEYINPQGLRFTRNAGDNKWTGEDGSILIEAAKDSQIVLSRYNPGQELTRSDPGEIAQKLGLSGKERFAELSETPGIKHERLPDGSLRSIQKFGDGQIVVKEGEISFVKTADGVYRIEPGQPTWYLDKNNILWHSNEAISVGDKGLIVPGQITFSSPEGFTFKQNMHGKFWDYGPAGAAWVDSSGKHWFRRPGQSPGNWTGEDGSFYQEGSWNFTPRTKHDQRRAVQGVSAVAIMSALSRPATAKEGEKEMPLDSKHLTERLRSEGVEIPADLLLKLMRAAGKEIVQTGKRTAVLAPTLAAGTIAQDQLQKHLYEANQRAASHLRPETPDLVPEPKAANTKETEAPAQDKLKGPETVSLGPQKLTEADLIKRIEALKNFPVLEGEEKLKAEFIQQSLLDSAELYHKVALSSVNSATAKEAAATYEALVRKSIYELKVGLTLEKELGIFGPATRAAYNEFMSWAQKDAGPALMSQIRQWTATTPPNQVAGLIDEASGKAMSPELYMSKLLAGQLKVEGLLNPEAKSFSTDDISRLENTFKWLTEARQLLALKQLQNREFAMATLIKDSGLPKEWLRKKDEALPQYLERVENFVQLAMTTKITIDRYFDLWKRSKRPDFEFSLPPGASLKMKNSDIEIRQDNLHKPEIQKLLREGTIELVRTGMKGDLRWDHPPGAQQGVIDWILDAKKRTDKIESTLDDIRKHPDKIIMYQDKPIIGMAVKLDAQNRFAGLVSPDTTAEKPGEVISKNAGLLSYDFSVEKITSGPDAGKYKVLQTIQAYTAPPLAYMDTRALGMDPVGEASVVSEKIYSADELLPVMNGNQVEYVKASELSNHKLLQQFNYYFHKGITAAFDLSILASIGTTATGLQAVRAMSAVEIAAASQATAANTIKWRSRDSVTQYSLLFLRGAAVGTAPLNSTGGMMLKYNDMPIGEWINHGRGIFYLSEMGVGLAKGGWGAFRSWKEAKEVAAGNLTNASKRAADRAAGNYSSTEKLHEAMSQHLPELMKVLGPIDKSNKLLQYPMGGMLSYEFYEKFAGHRTHSLDAAPDQNEAAALSAFEKMKLAALLAPPKLPEAKQSFQDLFKAMTLETAKSDQSGQKLKEMNSLLVRLDSALSNPSDKSSLESVKAELLSNLTFSSKQIQALELASPDPEFKLQAKDLESLLDPQKRQDYPLELRKLAQKFLDEKGQDLLALSRLALLELAKRGQVNADQSFSGSVQIEAYSRRSQMPVSAELPNEQLFQEVPQRTLQFKLSHDLISKLMLKELVSTAQTQKGILAAQQLYAAGKIQAEQLGALYQDLLENPAASPEAIKQALNGNNGAGLAWLVETLRSNREKDANLPVQVRMGEKEFLAALRNFASAKGQPDELRALAAAQLQALRRPDPGDGKDQNFRFKELESIYRQFQEQTKPDSAASFANTLKNSLLKDLNGSTGSGIENRLKQLSAAETLLLLTKNKNEADLELKALQGLAKSFSLESPALAVEVLKAMDEQRLKDLDKQDKAAADLLRRQALSLLSVQAAGQASDEKPALSTLHELERLFKDADHQLKFELKAGLLSLIDSNSKTYASRSAAIRSAAIDMLAKLGAADAAAIIREHISAGASFVKDGQEFKFVERDAAVRLSALQALEKLDAGLPKNQRLENYLPVLLTREADPTVSAAMQLAADRLGVDRTDTILDGSTERTIAALMMQTLNDRESGKRGLSKDIEKVKAWIAVSYDLLSESGLKKTAESRAKGLLTRLLSNTESLTQQESKFLRESMDRQFAELAEMAGSNEEAANLAKRALHGIITGEIELPGSKKSPTQVRGSYDITLQGADWQKRAAEALAKIAATESSSKDLTAAFLLDALFESRDPAVSTEILKGLKTIAIENPLKVRNFVSHRLAEYLDLEQVKKELSGAFVAELMDFAHELNDPQLNNKLAKLRATSPYKEVRDKANELLIKNADPLGVDLKAFLDQSLSLEKRQADLQAALGASEDQLASALRNLGGQKLPASAEAALLQALLRPEPRLKLLAARLLLSSSDLNLESDTARKAVSELAKLALKSAAANAEEHEIDRTMALRKSAVDSLQLLNAAMKPGESFSLTIQTDADTPQTLNIVKNEKGIELVSNTDQAESGKTGTAEILSKTGFIPANTRSWLNDNYQILSAKGLNKFAAQQSRSFFGRQMDSTDKIIHEEKVSLIKQMETAFKDLEKKASSSQDGEAARKALYAIVTGQVKIPGSKHEAITIQGSYPIKLAQDEFDWPVKAAEALARIAASGEAAAKDSEKLLFDALLEARNPRVAEAVLSGLQEAAADKPESTMNLVVHRLKEYLELKEMKDEVSGKFISSLMEFAFKQDASVLNDRLPALKKLSPYQEVREKAAELRVRGLDPLAADLKLQPESGLDLNRLKTDLQSSLTGDIDKTARALRNLDAMKLHGLEGEVQSALKHTEPRIKLLAAALVLSDKSGVPLDSPLARESIGSLTALALTLPAGKTDENTLDSSMAVRQRAMQTLQLLSTRLDQSGKLALPTEQGQIELFLKNGILEARSLLNGKEVAHAFADGRALSISKTKAGEIIINRNGIEYIPSKVRGLWTEKQTELTLLSAPDRHFEQDMQLLWSQK